MRITFCYAAHPFQVFFHIYDLSITQTWNTFLNPFRYISQNQQSQKTTTSPTILLDTTYFYLALLLNGNYTKKNKTN